MATIRSGLREAGDAADAAGLTPREREILVSFAGGMSYVADSGRSGVSSR